MEWIETTAETIEEAKESALDKLGVDDGDAEFEVLEEPRKGLFGKTRGQARVRARVAPKSPRAKDDQGRRRSKRGADKSGEAASSSATGGHQESASAPAGGSETNEKRASERQAKEPSLSAEDIAPEVENFLSGLVTAFGFESEVTSSVTDSTVTGEVTEKLGLLVGPKGRTLDAIQELARASAARRPSTARVRVDVGGYRETRRLALEDLAQRGAATAESDGVEVVLEPMSSADRKVVHDALNGVAGVSTRSAGTDPRRRVIIVPAAETEGADG